MNVCFNNINQQPYTCHVLSCAGSDDLIKIVVIMNHYNNFVLTKSNNNNINNYIY